MMEVPSQVLENLCGAVTTVAIHGVKMQKDGDHILLPTRVANDDQAPMQFFVDWDEDKVIGEDVHTLPS
jgi:hypothetical protein